MITKRLRNLLRLSILISLRQGYFLVRNWYLLLRFPYLTIKGIRDTGDKSQFVLISLTALTPALLYLIAKAVCDVWKYGRVVVIGGNVLVTTGIVQMVVLGYLLFWTLMVLFKDKDNGNS